MADENDIYPRLRYTGNRWRRKRSVQGKDWKPPTMQDVKAGVWCPSCRVRHGYNGYGKVLSTFEKRGSAWVLMWLCPVRGDVIGELWTGSVLVQRESNDDSGG